MCAKDFANWHRTITQGERCAYTGFTFAILRVIKAADSFRRAPGLVAMDLDVNTLFLVTIYVEAILGLLSPTD